MKSKQAMVFILGIIIGISITHTDIVSAASNIVSVFLSPHITYTVNGINKEVPEDSTTLIYGNRVYVPARFIAEALGGQVEWDEKSKTIGLKSPAPEYIYIEKETDEEKETEIEKETKEELEEESKEEKEEKESTKDIDDFNKLPLFYEDTSMKIEITNIFFDNNQTRVYIVLTNKLDKPIQLDQSTIVAKVNEKEYKVSDAPSIYRNNIWYNDIRSEETMSGYITLPVINEDEPGMEIEFTIFENDVFQKTYTPSFEITWHNK